MTPPPDASSALPADYRLTAEESALVHRAHTAHQRGDLATASGLYVELERRRPGHPIACYYAALVAQAQRHDDAAIRLMTSVVAKLPAMWEAHHNLAKFYQERAAGPNLLRAEAHYLRVLALKPEAVEAMSNLGNVYAERGDVPLAEACWIAARATVPDNPEAQFNSSFLALRAGDFAEGWALYESRWKCPAFVAEYDRREVTPRWDGAPQPRDMLVLLMHEQGAGDWLQFCRWVPWAAERAPVILEVPLGMMAIAEASFGHLGIGLVELGIPVVGHACHLPLLSLPFLAQVRTADDLRGTPYLRAA